MIPHESVSSEKGGSGDPNRCSRVYLSGGWGYGNLGDDALLDASLRLIKATLSGASITIASFDPQATEELSLTHSEDIQVSIHRVLFGSKYLDRLVSTASKKHENLLGSRVLRFVASRLAETRATFLLMTVGYVPSLALSILARKLEPISNAIKESSIVLLGGGGYINSWKESLLAHSLEVLLAKKHRVPVAFLGQTIGPFTGGLTRRVARIILNEVCSVSVRDRDSQQELRQLGVVVRDELIPDLAIMRRSQSPKGNIVVFVPFVGVSADMTRRIADLLYRTQLEYGSEIRVVTSQYWKVPNKIACLIAQSVKDLGGNASAYSPATLHEFEQLTADARLVISQNLHGLVIPFSAGSNIICLNARRKFITFMEICGKTDCLFDLEKLDDLVFFRAIQREMTSDFDFHSVEKLARLVESHAEMVLNELCNR